MDNDDLREIEEDKSLLKDMSKKGISKIIKTMPLSTKIYIIAIGGFVIFLLFFTVLLAAVVKMMFFNGNIGGSGLITNFTYINTNAEDNYWWPIGGSEVSIFDGKEYAIGQPSSTIITSNFSPSRTINGVTKAHYGMDIGSFSGADYIIAVSKGTVYSASNTCDNNGYYGNTCGGGGLGNYVIIEHAGNVYTIYAHLYPGSITVSKGDVVNQGQIIGRMGNSGSSTGAHLHFQIEVGGRSSSYAEDPLNYISQTKSRPVTITSGLTTKNEMLAMLQSWEGTGPTDGDYYIVYDDGTGVLTVGHGVTLKHNVEKFKERGIDTSTLSKGSKVEKSIVDSIELEEITEKRTSVVNLLNKNNITLEEYQIDALTIRMYNVGNVKKFPENYELYGNTQDLYENFMNKPVTGGGKYMSGLDRRRQAEWNLFHNGIYTYNS